ncbi:hypothetical protein [Microcoleus sp. CAWBG52]|uniref:hypothetical protein n=1 Tax=Microcoleus sp. CAWBG52 TaxID=2841649 RepID=UPI0025F4599D|nr:hypothetical protein [Microcoleus sp. CAWBG52]
MEKTRFLGPGPLSQETGFLPKSMGCNEVFRKKPGFWGLGDRIFGWMGDRIFGLMCDRI